MKNGTEETPPNGIEDDSTDSDRSRGGQEAAPEVKDRPEQNVGYDEAVKGRPLTPEEKRRATRESPLRK
jgi:hypothetical protein